MTPNRRILVIGRDGQLALELARARWPDGWSVICAARTEIDLSVPDRAADAVIAIKPDIVVNAAAYTNVERAESEFQLALTINATSPAAVARACAKIGAKFLTVSTDYVFDGAKAGPYREDDPINPLGAYGRSKADGEAMVRDATAEHVILRTSWLFSPFGTNFVKTMMQLGGERPILRVVADQRGCPTAAADLARAIAAMCVEIDSGNGRYGTFHVANSGATTWYELANAIFETMNALGERVPDQVIPITSAEYPTKAARPANSVLDCSLLDRSYGVRMRPWRLALGECLNELIGQKQHMRGAT